MFQRNKKRKYDDKILDPEDPDEEKRSIHSLSQAWGFFVVALILTMGYFSMYRYHHMPDPLHTDSENVTSDQFIAGRAYQDLKILNDFGPRPTGSYSNEVLAVDFLKREIAFIEQVANRNQKIETDLQIVSGAYYANFKPHGMTNVYRNVQNVIVRLAGVSDKTLMLNCHFDSVAGSPGASDDAGNCCIMLEILRVLSRQPYINRHTILFLFNGAEETPLQASHGFITQHAWAKEIQAFLNLESVGMNGKEMLFQSGPFHPWLIKMYAKSVPHPNAQAAAEEVFQSGVIPSDTDFRIFRDFGEIPGLDFAHVVNGYQYHTKYDSIRYVSKGVMQRVGDNILALTNEIANSDELDNTEEYAMGKAVYFDFLGYVFVEYSQQTGDILNVVIAVVGVVLPFVALRRATRGVHRNHLLRQVVFGLAKDILCVVLAGAVNYGIGTYLDFKHNAMSWYSRTYLVIGLYCIPTFLIQCLINCFGTQKSPISLGLRTQARLVGSNLFWSIILLCMTFFRYRTGYVIMFVLSVSILSSLINWLFGLQNSVSTWLICHVVGQCIVLLWTTHFYHVIMEMFIPIAGRSGGLHNPDINVALLCTILTVFITSFLAPLIRLLRGKGRTFMLVLLLVSILTLFNTSSLCYDDNENSPKPQRHFITHTQRTFYDAENQVRYIDSGFWFRELDRNARKTIDSLVAPDVPVSQLSEDFCNKEAFCGLPVYSCRQLHTGGFWVPGPAPLVREVATLTLTGDDRPNNNTRRLNFTLSGNTLTSFLIRPKPGISLINWSFTTEIPVANEYKNEKGYFVMITHGVQTTDSLNITLEFKSEAVNQRNGSFADINVVTTHWEYSKEHTPTFAHMLAKMPKWAFAVPSVASIVSRIF